nr:class I SAM-dependent methyltransferase [Paenibacillus monticola]
MFEIAGQVDIKDKEVFNVGCGRGSNSVGVEKYYKAAFLRRPQPHRRICTFRPVRHKGSNMFFFVGDAENLPFEGETFKFGVQLESRHPDIHKFYDSMYRVLKTGDHIQYGDMLPTDKWQDYDQYLISLSFEILCNQDIT